MINLVLDKVIEADPLPAPKPQMDRIRKPDARQAMGRPVVHRAGGPYHMDTTIPGRPSIPPTIFNPGFGGDHRDAEQFARLLANPAPAQSSRRRSGSCSTPMIGLATTVLWIRRISASGTALIEEFILAEGRRRSRTIQPAAGHRAFIRRLVKPLVAAPISRHLRWMLLQCTRPGLVRRVRDG